MWTAAHVFFYGCTFYFSKNNKKGLFIAASAVLVHFSFLLPVGLLLIYVFAKPPHKFLFYLFLATFFISSLNLEFVGKFIQSYAPETFEARASNYTDEDYAETIAELNASANWYAVNLNKVLLWAITAIYCVFYFRIKKLKQVSLLGNLMYGFSLVLLITANLLSGVPSGSRFMLIAQLFAIGAIFITISKISKPWINNFNYFISFLIFFIVVSTRNLFDTLTIDTVLSNPLIALYAKTGFPLINLIK